MAPGEEEQFRGIVGGDPELRGMERDSDEMRFSEMIDRIDREQLGRALVIRDSGPQSTRVRQTDAGADIEMQPSQTRDTVIGISLSLGSEQHLLVFKNGAMLVTEPRYTDQGSRDDYKEIFDANEEPFAMDRQRWRNIPDAVNRIRGVDGKGLLGARVTDSLHTEQDLTRFDGYFGKAIEIAAKRKEQQEAVRRKGMRAFTDKLEETIFKQPEPPPGSERPPDQPPSK